MQWWMSASLAAVAALALASVLNQPAAASPPPGAAASIRPALAPAPASQASCTFMAGFKALRDLIPSIVGDCLENERHNPENGDGLQLTTGGLMAWRKADNWTAFTNGTTTWINGPLGLQSRANGDRFPWESAAPPPPPPQITTSAPAQPAPADTPEPERPLVSSQPRDALLKLEEVGKEIKQESLKQGSDSRAKWAEVRFERPLKDLDASLGPVWIVNRVYVANNVAGAQAIFKEEVGKQAKMPESREPVGGRFNPEGIESVGDEQDSLAACNVDCSSRQFKGVHQRTVARYENAVVILYFYGGRDSATAAQMNEWLPLNLSRLGASL